MNAARRLAVLVVALLALGIAPTAYARTEHVLTIDDTTGRLPAAQTAAAWGKARGVAYTLGPCSGGNCIHLAIADVNAGRTGFYTSAWAGYTYVQADGSALVQVDVSTMTMGAAAILAVTEHEVGHGSGLPHTDPAVDPRSIMTPTLNLYSPPRGPDSSDLRNLGRLYP